MIKKTTLLDYINDLDGAIIVLRDRMAYLEEEVDKMNAQIETLKKAQRQPRDKSGKFVKK